MGKTLRTEKVKIFCAFVVLIFCECIFFRNVLWQDSLIADRADGRLTNLLAEHWWRFFQGKEAFSELLMFYPAKGVLGYTDMLLGHGLIYAVFRMTGMNMFASYKFTLIFMHGMGTLAMFYLLRKKLKVSYIWSTFGTIAFCCSDTLSKHLIHTQLMAVCMLPVLMILFISFIQNLELRKNRNVFAYLLISWLALLTYTAWYVAFFTGLFGMIFFILSFISFKKAHLELMDIIKKWIAVIRYDLIGYIIFLIVIFVPFIYVYLPVFQTSSGYSYSDVSIYLPEIIDLVHVSDHNYMMGWLMKILKLDNRGYSGELAEGFSCVLLSLFFIMFFVWRNNRQKQNLNESMTQKRYFLVVKNIFITIMLCLVLIIRLGSNGVSLWAFVYYLIPAAKSIRAVARFLLWLSFPMAVVTSYCADQYLSIQSKGRAVSVVLTALVFASNVNASGVFSMWSAGEEFSFINGVSSPPENAESFYIIDSQKEGDAAYIYQLDAFEIATYYSLKTINGYSGQFPNGWDGIWDVCSNNYESMVYEWIDTNKLANVFSYDRAKNTWMSYEERKALCMDPFFWPFKNKFSISSGLEDSGQGEYAWTSQNFKTIIKNTKIREDGLLIKLSTELGNYMLQNPELEPYIKLYVDDEYVQDLSVKDGYAGYMIPMQDHVGDEYKIELKTNCYFNPKDVGINGDTRNLSIALYYIGN